MRREYGYDSHYFLVTETHPETGLTLYGRDAVGNLISRQVGLSGVTTYTYDGLNRLTFTNYPGPTPDVSYQYDPNGNLEVLDNGTSRRVLTYDANNNVRTESLTVGSLTLNAAYGVNALDQLTSITYPSLRQVSYAPDALGRPTVATPYLTSVVHHPNGIPKTLSFGNGHVTATTLTNRQWLDTTVTQKTGPGIVVNLNYDYDGLANVTKITNTLDTTDTQTLTYDGLDRLLTAGTASLAYDATGNLTSYTTPAGTLSYGYSDQRLATVTGRLSRSYLYDAYGHTVSDGTRTLSFDDAGNLRTAGLTSYDYDCRNQRIRTRAPGGIETTSFTGHQGLLLGEYAPDGSVTREYAYLGTRLLALIDHDSLGSERTTTLHPNALGSPVAATDSTGALLWKETYHPYGERKQKPPNATNNPRWYTGHPEDPETGLVYAGARYYDPVIGRFLSTDPVSFTEKNLHSFNRYGYGNNNPYKYIDPDGREVRLQWHVVALGDYHTLVRITPENQARYANDPRFSNIDDNGRHYATMGAGPVSGRLVSDFNRERDAEPHEGGSIIQPPKGLNEDKFIDRLIGLDAKYADNLDYDLYPANPQDQKWWRADDGYNSNSYTSGLLGASGVLAPRLPVSTPGWDKPVPQEYFR